jgi:hypothetical protein
VRRFKLAARTALAALVFGVVTTAAMPAGQSVEAAAMSDRSAFVAARQASVARLGLIDDAYRSWTSRTSGP